MLSGPRDDLERVPFGLALLAIVGVGVLLRGLHLDIPMRYDESVTFMSYASHGWQHVTTSYENPNNHVLHSLLVWLSTELWGSAPSVIRLPSLLAGCALVPLTAWVGLQAYGRGVALLAAAVVATAPILIEFSTNARGWSILAACVLLAVGAALWIGRGRGLLGWLLLAEAGVVGMYTLPVMLLPWLGLCIWLACSLWNRRWRGLLPLVATNAGVALVVLALYSGILVSAGFEALAGNRYVAPEPLGHFLLGAPAAVAGVGSHWARGLPLLLAIPVGAATLWALRPDGPGRDWRLLVAALVAGSAVMMLLTRNWGEPRIWLWGVPLLAITAAAGSLDLARRVTRATPALVAVGTAGAWVAGSIVWILIAQPVRASTETGVFPEVVDVMQAITAQFREGDNLVSDFVSTEPMKYYLGRWAATREPEARAPVERVWVVYRERDPQRARVVRERLGRLGVPPLEESTPMFSTGGVHVYLFGRPGGSPDVRLLEAVDWHTGVAGEVDEARAGALLAEVSRESDAPVVRGWLARCRALGCMDHATEEASADMMRDVLFDLRELATAGEPEAAFLYGWLRGEGVDAPPDPTESARWYRAAAEVGHALAARVLGDAFATGVGVDASDQEAVRWWRRAAEVGDARAQLRLGQAYEVGRGVPTDAARARSWYEEASRRRAPGAVAALQRLDSGP